MADKVKKIPIKLFYKDLKQKSIPSFQMFQIDCDWFTMVEKNYEITGQVEKGESRESRETGESSPFSNITSKKGNFPLFRILHRKRGIFPLNGIAR